MELSLESARKRMRVIVGKLNMNEKLTKSDIRFLVKLLEAFESEVEENCKHVDTIELRRIENGQE